MEPWLKITDIMDLYLLLLQAPFLTCNIDLTITTIVMYCKIKDNKEMSQAHSLCLYS